MKSVSVDVRSGTAAEWAASGLVLGEGEIGIDTTNNVLKVGDGTTAFASLPTTPATVTPVEVTGTRSDGAALTALLTALDSMGIIIDSTTAGP